MNKRISRNTVISQLGLFLSCTFLLLACQPAATSNGKQPASQENPDESQPTEIASVSEAEPADSILFTYQTTRGKVHQYYQKKVDYRYQLFVQITTPSGIREQRIPTPYSDSKDSYDFYEDGTAEPLYYLIAKDQKHLYLVSSLQANGSGFLREYQLYRVDCERNTATYIQDFAAIKTVADGFQVAEGRITNEDSAVSEAEYQYVLHDEIINCEGKVIRKSAEYPYESFVKAYPEYVMGFKMGKK